MSEHTTEPQLPPDLEEVLQYLYGAGPLDGCWYGDGFQPTGSTAPFWWRSKLRAAIRSYATALCQQGEPPDDGELEAWRCAADALLSHKQPTAYELRRAAMLLQNAYLFARSLRVALSTSEGKTE